MRTALSCGLLLILTAPSLLAATTQEHVGSWVINCPGSGPCVMRFNMHVLDKAGVTGDLEVMARGRALVPVLTLRGLSSELLTAAGMAGRASVSMQFAAGTHETLDCAISQAGYICAPNGEAAAKLAAGLATARQATVRVALTIAGISPLPPQERSMALAGTADALVRLRILGATPVPTVKSAPAAQSPEGLLGAADRALKAAGYPDGVAGLQARLGQYLRK